MTSQENTLLRVMDVMTVHGFMHPDRRWGFFPGGSVAYRISQEDFWKNSKILSFFNDFKIRASYGIIPFNHNCIHLPGGL